MGSWSKDEEEALHRAHFELKPCEDFWLQIARKVPGRTAKECYGKYFSGYPTPPQQQPRASRRVPSSPVRVLQGEAFMSGEEICQGKERKRRSRKPSASASRKLLRKIMREHSSADADGICDGFADLQFPRAVEKGMPCAVIDGNKSACPLGQDGLANRRWRVAREGSSRQPQTGSPEVLRRVVNQDELDRYLDVLHTQKDQDTAGTKHRSRLTIGTVRPIRKKALPSVSSATCAIVSAAERALRKCGKLKAHQSDAIDHTFDEESSDGGTEVWRTDPEPSSEGTPQPNLIVAVASWCKCLWLL